MQELDFLPAAYREQNAVHKARICQLAMILTFGAIITLAACFQFALYRAASQELNSIAKQHEDAIAKTRELAALRLEVDHSRQIAELYTYLKYPWPRTQLLAEITKHLPPEVVLRELTIVEEAQKTFAPVGVIAVDVANQKSAGETPAKEDLDLLRIEQDRCRPEIEISGTTTDSSGQLYVFVVSLNRTPLFETAKLNSIEAVPGSEQDQSNFLIRLTARPGYGQSDGPREPPAIAAQDSSARSLDRS